jgi:uncharacterized protein YhhL (DUF1145 family)
MSTGNGERDRAIVLALVATFICLWIGKALLGFFWVVALVAAVVIFTICYALVLRAQRGRHQ